MPAVLGRQQVDTALEPQDLSGFQRAIEQELPSPPRPLGKQVDQDGLIENPSWRRKPEYSLC